MNSPHNNKKFQKNKNSSNLKISQNNSQWKYQDKIKDHNRMKIKTIRTINRKILVKKTHKNNKENRIIKNLNKETKTINHNRKNNKRKNRIINKIINKMKVKIKRSSQILKKRKILTIRIVKQIILILHFK